MLRKIKAEGFFPFFPQEIKVTASQQSVCNLSNNRCDGMCWDRASYADRKDKVWNKRTSKITPLVPRKLLHTQCWGLNNKPSQRLRRVWTKGLCSRQTIRGKKKLPVLCLKKKNLPHPGFCRVILQQGSSSSCATLQLISRQSVNVYNDKHSAI